jgi:hypothetical protein
MRHNIDQLLPFFNTPLGYLSFAFDLYVRLCVEKLNPVICIGGFAD